ncbi:MAG TPA: septum formation initiator family protein [Bryobacteraceae bacterium]|nr:septum formation initiator family protein [Bryobacteraceae bacterium]
MRPSLTKIGYALAILLTVGYAFFTLRGPQGIPALADKRRQIQELEERNATLAREIEVKRERIGRLRESPSLQELEIRQRLKLVQPDERVYILQDKK